ncbi:MAG: SGNH/GDSL hydrolase family protein [Pseudomonadota bacterium]
MSIQGDQVFFFGDSLTDTGVLFAAAVEALTAQIFEGLLAGLGPDPSPVEVAQAQALASILAFEQATVLGTGAGLGPEGAVTNEFTHANYFGDASGADVTNFANAGARALGTQEALGEGTGYDINLGAQIARFLTSLDAPLEPSSKAVLFIGSNDFSDIVGDAIDDPDGNIFGVIAAATAAVEALLASLEASARILASAGVGTIFFGTLPSATFFPGSDGLDGFEAGLSDLALDIYNGLLTALAGDLSDEGIDVQIIDYAAIADAVNDDPSSFGIVADRDDFLIDGSIFDSDQVGFWDPIHPAEAVHQAWGAFAAFVMEGGSTAALSDFGTLNFQDNGDNAVFAKGGNDTVFARGGDDIVFGGSGNDALFAGSGDDIVSAGSGNDFVIGDRGNDMIDGGSGNDALRGGSGDDVLIDGLGSDTVHGGRGDDVFIYVEGTLEGDDSAAQDILKGGWGSDTLYLVLTEDTFDLFESQGAGAVLTLLGIVATGIETIAAIDGRGGVEGALGGFSWFEHGDLWGLIPAPTPTPPLPAFDDLLS